MKIIFTIFVLIISTTAFAWENTVTHRQLSEAAAHLAIPRSEREQFSANEGQNKSLLLWLQDGAEFEDSGSILASSRARYRNHFHNPLANLTPPLETLTQGGLTDAMTGQSALFWAQDSINQGKFEKGDWSWRTVRDHYYHSLTETDTTRKDESTAKTYLGLGYQMHLVQDMSQPDHVRNDAHPVDGDGRLWGFETWAKRKFDLIQQYSAPAIKPSLDLTQPLFTDFAGFAPVGKLIDSRRYVADRTPSANTSQGLAEYTNANFFSDDTIFAARYTSSDKHYFPYPRKEGTDIRAYFAGTKAPEIVISEDGKAVKGLWISKTGEGEKVPHLVRVGAMADFAYTIFGEGRLFYTALGRDEITYEDYAKLLVPRAVGYSAALLDYFFRGKLDLKPKPGGVSSSSITLTATNVTASGEEMTKGEIKLVVRYRHVIDPDDPTTIQFSDYQYKVFTYPGCTDSLGSKVCTLLTGVGADFTFDLSADPLPDWANDVSAQLVFRGRLGKEEGAVAVGFVQLKVDTKNLMISLPASGAYASTAGSTGFKQISLNAMTQKEGGLKESDGVLELKVMFRVANSDQFQGSEVTTTPADDSRSPNGPYSYYVITATAPGIAKLEQNVATPFTFNLPQALPLQATDVYFYLVYRHIASNSAQALAVGFQDISEPTPIDVYNNTDKVCLNGAWYDAVSNEAMAIADTNHDGYADLTDIFKHDISDIYYQPGGSRAGSKHLFSYAGPMQPGSGKRLGYILADYTFSQSLAETVTLLDSRDTWTLSYDDAPLGVEGFVNQKRGTWQGYSGMYDMRGYKMHGGAGIVFDNQEYPEGSDCSWDLLRTPPVP